jgi:hypothetical protein
MACARTVLPRHAKGIRQGLACWLVLEATQEWHHRQTVRIIHELYANSASTPIIEGQTTELYRIEQGVAQGPMSPTLFNVFIDDLLDDLQTQCHDDGIPISSALDRLVGMAYADDLKTVSGTRAFRTSSM